MYYCVPGGVSPVLSVKEARDAGYRVMITPTVALEAVYEAVESAYGRLRDEGVANGNGVGVRKLFEACGLEEAVEFDNKAGGTWYAKGV